MEEKLKRLYLECILELKKIGIDTENVKEVGEIYISISKRNNKRYGVCKQENPDEKTKYISIYKGRRIVRYGKYKMHYIEISPWVLELEDKIIKNTIIHEIIHCMPYANNHGDIFKKYANYINKELGYEISRVRK